MSVSIPSSFSFHAQGACSWRGGIETCVRVREVIDAAGARDVAVALGKGERYDHFALRCRAGGEFGSEPAQGVVRDGEGGEATQYLVRAPRALRSPAVDRPDTCRRGGGRSDILISRALCAEFDELGIYFELGVGGSGFDQGYAFGDQVGQKQFVECAPERTVRPDLETDALIIAGIFDDRRGDVIRDDLPVLGGLEFLLFGGGKVGG